MNLYAAAFLCLIGLLFAGATIELVRRRYIRPEYGLVWIVIALGTGALTLLVWLAPWLLRLMGLTYQSAVILLWFLFTIGVLMTFTIVANRQGKRIIRLTQESALMRMEIERLRAAQQQSMRGEEKKEGS